MLFQPQPFIVRLAPPPPAHETTLFDIFVGSVMVVGLGFVIAAACGAVLAWLFVRWNRRGPGGAHEIPSISPVTAARDSSATNESVPPSSPTR
jgi:hypothetical protein